MFPGDAGGQEPACRCSGNWISILGPGKIRWRRKWQAHSSVLTLGIPWTEESEATIKGTEKVLDMTEDTHARATPSDHRTVNVGGLKTQESSHQGIQRSMSLGFECCPG